MPWSFWFKILGVNFGSSFCLVHLSKMASSSLMDFQNMSLNSSLLSTCASGTLVKGLTTYLLNSSLLFGDTVPRSLVELTL